MGYLDDVSTIVKSMSNAKNFAGKNQHKSIAKGALEGTLQFPCLISDAISIDMASTIARTLERVYASFVQTYLSLNNTIDISVDKNPNMFLKKFHQNVKVEATVDDLYQEYCMESDEEYEALMERIYNGTTTAFVNESENKMILFNASHDLPQSVIASNKELLTESLSAIDFKPFPNIGNSPFYEADDDDIVINDTKTGNLADKMNIVRAQETIKAMNNAKAKNAEYLSRKDAAVPALLKDTDVKKQNDLQPYLMQVRLMAINNENEFVQFMDFVVGIKVVLHNIKSNEMMINVANSIQQNGKLFNFIRWTTGEKSLFKDLLLHVNDVKLDVANRSKGSSKWWLTLKRLKETSRAQSAFFAKNQVVPNSTIVLSSYEVDAIRNNSGYNLRDVRFALQLMKSLFLMNFAIVDEGTHTIDILYDGETHFQTYALETLEREVSMNSSKLSKELTRMISR